MLQVLAKDDPKADEDDEDYVSYPVGEHIFRVSTAHTEEKANALNMLSCYAEHMGHSFAPYCMDVAATVEHVLSTPLLNNEEMRSTAAGLVPLLLGCMQDAHKQSSFAEATPEAVQALFGLLMKGLVSVRCSLLPHFGRPPALPREARRCSRHAGGLMGRVIIRKVDGCARWTCDIAALQ